MPSRKYSGCVKGPLIGSLSSVVMADGVYSGYLVESTGARKGGQATCDWR